MKILNLMSIISKFRKKKFEVMNKKHIPLMKIQLSSQLNFYTYLEFFYYLANQAYEIEGNGVHEENEGQETLELSTNLNIFSKAKLDLRKKTQSITNLN